MGHHTAPRELLIKQKQQYIWDVHKIVLKTPAANTHYPTAMAQPSGILKESVEFRLSDAAPHQSP